MDRLGSMFRSQLRKMVDNPSTDAIVSWSESGKSFIVWDEVEFRRDFFPRDDLESLGFRKVEESDKWEYACDYFVRGQPELKPPRRQYDIPREDMAVEETDSLVPLSSLSCYKEMAAIVYQRRSALNKARPQRRSCLIIPQMYEMVDDPSTDSIISWSVSGESFIIRNESEFLRDVLPMHLGFPDKEMSSFAKWLDVLGYRKLEDSDEQWEYAGDGFVRGQPPEPIPPYTPGGLMISPESGRRIEKGFASWKKAQKLQDSIK